MSTKIVQKFGGTSMGSVAALNSVVKIVQSTKPTPVVVVSAMSGVTNELLAATQLAISGKYTAAKQKIEEIAKLHFTTTRQVITNEKIRSEVDNYISRVLADLANFLKAIGELKELSIRSHDSICAVGERLSARMLAGILSDRGTPAEQVDLEKAIPDTYKIADGNFFVAAEKKFGQIIKKVVAKKKIPVATGYFGRVPGGMLGAVGRGYSDFCAALVAAGVHADKLEIWTDVSGVLTADPRKVPNAKILDTLSFEAAAELAHFGAKVIHPQSIHPAVRANIPVWIKNTFAPRDRGTEIVAKVAKPKMLISSVTSKKGITVVNIASYRMLMQYGFLAKIFEIFARYETSIDVVSTSEVSVSVTIENNKNLKQIVKELSPFSKVSVADKKAIVCLVGLGMQQKRGVAGEVFGTLGQAGISVDQISQGASEINITFVVDEKEADKAVAVLHKKFF